MRRVSLLALAVLAHVLAMSPGGHLPGAVRLRGQTETVGTGYDQQF